MTVKVEKLTDVSLLQRANSFTTNRESKMTLEKAYRYGHSPIRTQLFWVELTDIPLFVASQLVRSHVGVQHFQLSKRTDRGGEDMDKECREIVEKINFAYKEIDYSCADDPPYSDIYSALDSAKGFLSTASQRFDRMAPTDLAFLCNAEALMNMAHKRLCNKASKETQDVFNEIAIKVRDVDPALFSHLVPQCVYRGGICPEPKSCGFNKSTIGETMINLYNTFFD